MKARKRVTVKLFLAAVAAVSLPLAASRAAAVEGPYCPAPKAAAPAEPKTVTIKATVEEPPAVTIKLGARCAKAIPVKDCLDHTGGGNIDVQQPSADTLVVTMTGAVVAAGGPVKASVAGINFDLSQCFVVATEDPSIKNVKLTVEGRMIGLLRSNQHCCNLKACSTAEVSDASAVVTCDAAGEIASLVMPAHSAACGENVSINDREGPVCQFILPGCYTLHQMFSLTASHPKSVIPCKASSAEFADGAVDPLWISYKEPFKGAAKKDFGFQITIKVEPYSGDEEAPEKGEVIPAPKIEGKVKNGKQGK